MVDELNWISLSTIGVVVGVAHGPAMFLTRLLALTTSLVLPSLHAWEIQSPRPGHIFSEGEPVVFSVDGAPTIPWSVTEVAGPFRQSGEAAANETLPIETPHRGLYTLTVGQGGEDAATTFLVTWPRDAGVREGVGIFFTEVDADSARNMARMGVTGARLNFWFGQPQYAVVPPTDPTNVEDGSINFDLNRGFLDALLAAGIPADGMMASIEGIPPILAIDDDYKRGPKDREAYKWLIKRAVRAFPEVKYWEVWNEPDFQRFYTGTKQALADMTIDLYDALHELDPDTDKQVVFAGFTSKTSGPRWLAELLELGVKGKFDILSVHYTAGNQNDLDLFREALRGAGLGNLPIWNTEEDDPSPIGNLAEGIARTDKFIYAPADGSVGTSTVEGPDEHPTVHAAAMRTYSKMLSGAKFVQYHVGELAASDQFSEMPAVRIAEFARADASPLFAVWHYPMTAHRGGGTLSVRVDPGISQLSVVDDYGRETFVPVADGKAEIPIATAPLADGVADAPRPKHYVTGTSKLDPVSFDYVEDGIVIAEAETGAMENGFAPGAEYGFSGNGKASVHSDKDATPAITIPFDVAVAGDHTAIYLGTTLAWLDQTPSLVSPFRWKIDDGEWHVVDAMPPIDTDQMENAIDTAGAHQLGGVALSAGPHTVRIELTKPRGIDQFFFTRFDGFLFRRN